MNHRYLYIAIIGILLIGCDEETTIKPQPSPPISPEDTCYNDAPLRPYDSLHQQWPMRRYGISHLSLSSKDNLWAGEYMIDGWAGQNGNWGIFIYDPTKGYAIQFLKGWDIDWSPDGKQLLTNNGFGGFRIFDVDKMEFISIQNMENYSNPCWSLDGNWVLIDYDGKKYRVRPDGTELSIYAGRGWSGRELDSTHIVAFDSESMYIYDRSTSLFERIVFNNLNATEFNFSGIGNTFSLSPDKSKILLDIYSVRGFFEGRETAGLFLIDINKRTATKIRNQQYWGDAYRPIWRTDSTFYASYFCRTRSPKTSISMVWEFDLEGNFIKQITYPWMVLYPL